MSADEPGLYTMNLQNVQPTLAEAEATLLSRGDSDQEINSKKEENGSLYTFRSVKDFENLMQKKLNRERTLKYGSQELLYENYLANIETPPIEFNHAYKRTG